MASWVIAALPAAVIVLVVAALELIDRRAARHVVRLLGDGRWWTAEELVARGVSMLGARSALRRLEQRGVVRRREWQARSGGWFSALPRVEWRLR